MTTTQSHRNHHLHCGLTATNQGWAGIPVPVHSQEWRPLIPFPNFGNGFFSFPSRSRISGMDFFYSLPVPEFREWIFSIPFLFPNWPFQSRESKGKMGDFKRCLYLYSNIFSFLYISYKIKMGVLKSKLHMWRCPIKQHPHFFVKNHILAMVISKTFSFPSRHCSA